MKKADIKAIVKNLNKDELRDLISVAQGVLSALFSSDEIVDKDIFVKGVVVLLMSLLCLLSLVLT